MKKSMKFAAMVMSAVLLFSACGSKQLSVLIISGQNNHNWQVSHQALKLILDQSGLFRADVALTPEAGGDMSSFNPSFQDYDAVLLDYNGDDWNEQTRKAFIDYVRNGGGVIVYHAADNAFKDWKEFNKVIALGGWEGRNEKSGPYCYWLNGKLVKDLSAGPGGNHGKQREYPMHCRNAKHPITAGLPDNWIHGQDEMYDKMRGPANIKDILYTGKSDAETGGSGREEPLVFTVDYGDARIFHIMLGHAGKSLEDNPAMQCTGFQTLLLRGTEWAATGTVTQKVPKDFPTSEAPSFRLEYKSK